MGSCNFGRLWKNLLGLIYFKLHLKSCDYLYKCSSFQDLVPLKSEAQESKMEVLKDATAVQIEHDALQEVALWSVYCVLFNDV